MTESDEDYERSEAVEGILSNIRDAKERKQIVAEVADRIRSSSAARGVDLWAVEDCEFEPVEWAKLTGRDRSTVARNVRRARSDDE